MKLEGRRESANVDDRRQISGGGKATMGIGGIIVAGLIVWLMGGNPLEYVAQNLTEQSTTGYVASTEADDATTVFAKRILAGTEDVWTKIFKEKLGKQYRAPEMVLFYSSVQSGCGAASSSTGPFYCSADEKLYIDLSFFDEMEKQMHAGGDFAYAYVIAHEVGHHVQHLLGTLDQVHSKQSRLSTKESNQLSVRTELQADFYAGVWAHYDNEMFGSLEDGDIEEGINAANQIGDDRLQMQAQGYTVPDAFNHGTSAQRARWLKKGLQTGDMNQGNTFSINYNDL